MKEKSWYVYIIETDRGHLYTGITTDLERRFKEHATSAKGAKYFRGSVPVKHVFQMVLSNRSEASKIETLIKSLTRIQKLRLIQSYKLNFF